MINEYTLIFEAPDRPVYTRPGRENSVSARFHFERVGLKDMLPYHGERPTIRLAHTQTVDGVRRTTYSMTCSPEVAALVRGKVEAMPEWTLAEGLARRKQPIKPSRIGKKATTVYVEPALHERFRAWAEAEGLTVEAAIKRAMEMALADSPLNAGVIDHPRLPEQLALEADMRQRGMSSFI